MPLQTVKLVASRNNPNRLITLVLQCLGTELAYVYKKQSCQLGANPMKRTKSTFLALILLSPMAANAVPITISGFGAADGAWDVTALPNVPFSANQTLLEGQFWWGSAALAQEVAELILNSLGLPNVFGTEPPYYAYETLPDDRMHAWLCTFDCSDSVPLKTHQSLASHSYAVATRATVPEPGTLALFGLGLFGMGLSRRRRIART